VNTDFRIEVGFFRHPKTRRLIAALGLPAAWSLPQLWEFAAVNKPSGELSGMTHADIAAASWYDGDPEVFVAELLRLRWLDKSRRGLEIHDWAEHQPFVVDAPRRREQARRAAGAKWDSAADGAKKRHERLKEARSKGRHTDAEWGVLLAICGMKCLRCGVTNARLVKDHVQPIYQGGSDSIDNLQPLCASCNASKGPENKDLRPKGWAERLSLLMSAPAGVNASIQQAPTPTPAFQPSSLPERTPLPPVTPSDPPSLPSPLPSGGDQTRKEAGGWNRAGAYREPKGARPKLTPEQSARMEQYRTKRAELEQRIRAEHPEMGDGELLTLVTAELKRQGITA